MSNVEIIQLVIIGFLVPWNVALSWLAYNLGRENARLGERVHGKEGSTCSLHTSVMGGIDSKLDRLTRDVSELIGFLKSAGHDGARGEKGATGERGARGDAG